MGDEVENVAGEPGGEFQKGFQAGRDSVSRELLYDSELNAFVNRLPPESSDPEEDRLPEDLTRLGVGNMFYELTSVSAKFAALRGLLAESQQKLARATMGLYEWNERYGLLEKQLDAVSKECAALRAAKNPAVRPRDKTRKRRKGR